MSAYRGHGKRLFPPPSKWYAFWFSPGDRPEAGKSVRLWTGYLISILFVALGALLRLAMPGILSGMPYLAFYPAVVAAAGFCGRGPGLVATIASLLCVDLMFDETPSYIDFFDPVIYGRSIVFLAGGVGISFFAGMQHAIQARQRKQAAELQENEQRLRANFNNAAMGILEVDEQGRVIAANQHVCELLGYRAEEILGRSIHELTFAEDQPRCDELSAQICQGRLGRFEMEKRHLKSDGTPLWVHVTVSAIRDAQGRFLRAVGTVEDIGQRKAAVEELQRSEELRRLALEAAQMGTWDYDPVSGKVTCDPRTQAIFGAAAHDTTFQHLLQTRISSEDAARVEDAVRHAILPNSDGIFVATYRVIWPDGSLHWIAAHGQTMFEGEGPRRRAVRMVGTAQDVTDRQQWEEELKTAKDSAERAKADAEQANRAKDHFLAVLSHELRTPLTPVVMGLSMLEDRSDFDSQVRETLEMVHRNVEMEARLIDDLLDVTRISRGKIELNRTPVELCSVIHRAVEVCKPDLEARRLHFGIDLGPCAPYWVEADVPRLQQVFWNLLKNAIKFTPQGGCVGIRCRPHDKYVVAEVNDSGIGIEREALSRVFNAFEQAERSITRQFGGLGLGLAISKALVEMHGGAIEAHSDGRDRGASFRIRLPLAAPVSQPEKPAPAAPPRRVARSLRILLVEDHGVTARILQTMLCAEGHTVQRAGDLATALRLADGNGFDLLLSDLGLPDGSGHDLMHQLRQRGHFFPAIALSGYGQEEDIRRSRQAGFSAHLTKPASREAVVETIASVLGKETVIEGDRLSPSPSAAAGVFDAHAALERCLGEPEMLAQMIQYFFDDHKTLLPQICAAFDRGDFPEVGKLAHRFKGTIIHLGATLAAEAAAALERTALYGGGANEVEEALRWLDRECQLLKTALADYQSTATSLST